MIIMNQASYSYTIKLVTEFEFESLYKFYSADIDVIRTFSKYKNFSSAA